MWGGLLGAYGPVSVERRLRRLGDSGSRLKGETKGANEEKKGTKDTEEENAAAAGRPKAIQMV